jgi:hypothetical protein
MPYPSKYTPLHSLIHKQNCEMNIDKVSFILSQYHDYIDPTIYSRAFTDILQSKKYYTYYEKILDIIKQYISISDYESVINHYAESISFDSTKCLNIISYINMPHIYDITVLYNLHTYNARKGFKYRSYFIQKCLKTKEDIRDYINHVCFTNKNIKNIYTISSILYYAIILNCSAYIKNHIEYILYYNHNTNTQGNKHNIHIIKQSAEKCYQESSIGLCITQTISDHKQAVNELSSGIMPFMSEKDIECAYMSYNDIIDHIIQSKLIHYPRTTLINILRNVYLCGYEDIFYKIIDRLKPIINNNTFMHHNNINYKLNFKIGNTDTDDLKKQLLMTTYFQENNNSILHMHHPHISRLYNRLKYMYNTQNNHIARTYAQTIHRYSMLYKILNSITGSKKGTDNCLSYTL